MTGHINKQNMRFWAQSQPYEHTHHSLSQEKVTVWCAIGRNGIVGPYFFEYENENRVTVDTDRYIVLMRTKFIPALSRKRGVGMNKVIYEQDGAPRYCSDRSLKFLGQHFPGDRLISPDLNLCDYFLWGYPKERIYDNNPQTLADLKDNIRREIRRITAGMTRQTDKVLISIRFEGYNLPTFSSIWWKKFQKISSGKDWDQKENRTLFLDHPVSELSNLNLFCFKSNSRWEIDLSCWLKKLFQMVGPRRVITKLVILQADFL